MLYSLAPRSARDRRYRSLYLTERLNEEVFKVRTTQTEKKRFADLEADLEVFVNRRMLGPDYLFGLSPKGCGVWEIRSTYDPQIRVFGMFMKKDMLIATHLEQRGYLGGKQSRKWRNEIQRCRTTITNIFAPFQPLTTSDVNKVISGAIDAKYFRD